MQRRLALTLVPALLVATAAVAQERASRAQDRPLVEVKPSVANGARRAKQEEPAARRGGQERPDPPRSGLQRSPGRSLEDLRREFERIEAGDRAGGRERVPDRDHDHARAAERESASSSHTRRIVVRDGKIVVDEETRDGRPVTPSARGRGAPRVGVGGASDAERMLLELERELLRELPELDSARRGSGSSRSHTRRIVVRNGETIVDEETIDGRPVRPGARRPDPAAPAGPRVAPRADARASSSSSHTRRQVVRNGKVVVDEETVDGRPVKPGAKPPAPGGRPGDRMEELLRELERDLERQGAGDAARELERLRDGGRGAQGSRGGAASERAGSSRSRESRPQGRRGDRR